MVIILYTAWWLCDVMVGPIFSSGNDEFKAR